VKRRVINLHRVKFFFLAIAVLIPFSQAFGQSDPADHIPELACRLDRISPQNRTLSLSCVAYLPAKKFQLRFADQFAGVSDLSQRVYALKINTGKDISLPVEIRGDGLYLFETTGRSQSITISYEMRLARAMDPAQYALVSSLGLDAGFLMLADLLPRLCAEGSDCEEGNPVRLQIAPPPGWRIATTEKGREELFEIPDPRRAIFFLARMREKTIIVGSMDVRVAIAGDWSFGDEEVFKLAEAIAREQAAIIGGAEKGSFLITLAPFPQPLTGLRSSAVTTGGTGVLMLNPNNDAAATFAHYRRHLAHEMFHFYLPNAFRIRENFDWFWEGFTRYIALLTLARLRLIGQREYLDAIGAEYEAYWFNPLRNQISLIAVSPEKFANSANYDLVYRKGMLVAALYDLELRWQSRGKLNVADVMRNLYQNYALRGREVGNREVLDEMSMLGDFLRLIRDDIEGVRDIDLSERVKRYGLAMEWEARGRGRARLNMATRMSNRQQALFSDLTRD
jgi:predicted metalloprotease with PDZ domain